MMLFIDMDGVLADFDRGYREQFGVKLLPRDTRTDFDDVDWARVRSVEGFFRNLNPMPDMWELWDFVRRFDPTILTGIPSSVNPSENDKRTWGLNHFGPDVPMICCASRDKYLHCTPGAILIDDWEKYRDKWEAAGGIWITHTSAKDSIRQLTDYL